MDFKPENTRPAQPEWATYVPGRRPKFKMHNGKGQAKNAINYHLKGILFQWIDGKWVSKLEIEEGKYRRYYDPAWRDSYDHEKLLSL